MGAIGFINAFASCRLFQKTIFACVEITLLRMMHQSTIGAHPPAQPPGISQLPGEGPNMSVKRVGGTQERRKMPHPMYGPPFVKKSDLRNSPAIRKKKKKNPIFVIVPNFPTITKFGIVTIIICTPGFIQKTILLTLLNIGIALKTHAHGDTLHRTTSTQPRSQAVSLPDL